MPAAACIEDTFNLSINIFKKIRVQKGTLNASLQQVQLSAASSLQKRQLEVSRLDGVVKRLEADLTEVRRQSRSLEQDVSQRDEQLAQLRSELKNLQNENAAKVEEVIR
jgi:chromosome segregation ATPase